MGSDRCNGYTLINVNMSYHSKFKKIGSIHLVNAYYRCTTLIQMNFHVSVTEFFILFFWPENVDQNLR